MQNKGIALIGFLGVLLFVSAATLGGFQFENYDVLSQLISETAAVDAPYGKLLRWAGYIPSGILLFIFFLAAIHCFQKNTAMAMGFVGLAIFYGLGTVVVGIFPCDAGCNKEFVDPSLSQFIHVAMGMLTYLFVPMSLLLVALGIRRTSPTLSNLAIACCVISYALFAVIAGNPESGLMGLWQRIIEGSFAFWTAACARFIWNVKSSAHQKT